MMKSIYRVRVIVVNKETFQIHNIYELALREDNLQNENLIKDRIKEIYKPLTPLQYLYVKDVIKDIKIGEYEV